MLSRRRYWNSCSVCRVRSACMRKPAPPLRAARSRCSRSPRSPSRTPSARRSSPTTRRASGPKYRDDRRRSSRSARPESEAADQAAVEGQGPEERAARAACACSQLKRCKFQRDPGRGRRREERRPHPHLPRRLHARRPPARSRSTTRSARSRTRSTGRRRTTRTARTARSRPTSSTGTARTRATSSRSWATRPTTRTASATRSATCSSRASARSPSDVVVVGDRLKRDVIRADRADGIVIKNMTSEQASFNGLDVVETNGFLHRGRRRPLQPELRDPHVHLRQRAVRPRRGLRQRRLGPVPGLGPRGPLPALRHRDPQLELARQHARPVRHRRQRHVGPRLRSGSTTAPASSTTRSPPATRACRRTARSGSDNEVYSNNNNFFDEGNQEYCAEDAVRGPPARARLPAVPEPGGRRLRVLRREQQHHPRQPGLGQLALGLPAVLGARRASAATTRRGGPDATRRTATGSPATRSASRPNGEQAAQRRRRLLGRAGRRQLLGGQPGRRQGHQRPDDAAELRDRPSSAGRQPRQDRPRGAVRHVGPEGQPGPARLHVVHHAAEAASR